MIDLLDRPGSALEADIVDKESFGRRLAELRIAAGLSRPGLAEKTGIPLRTIEAWEQGRREPYVTTLPVIAKGLGISVAALLDDPEQAAAELPRRPGKKR